MNINIAETDFAVAIINDLCDQSRVLSTIYMQFSHIQVVTLTQVRCDWGYTMKEFEIISTKLDQDKYLVYDPNEKHIVLSKMKNKYLYLLFLFHTRISTTVCLSSSDGTIVQWPTAQDVYLITILDHMTYTQSIYTDTSRIFKPHRILILNTLFCPNPGSTLTQVVERT